MTVLRERSQWDRDAVFALFRLWQWFLATIRYDATARPAELVINAGLYSSSLSDSTNICDRRLRSVFYSFLFLSSVRFFFYEIQSREMDREIMRDPIRVLKEQQRQRH